MRKDAEYADTPEQEMQEESEVTEMIQALVLALLGCWKHPGPQRASAGHVTDSAPTTTPPAHLGAREIFRLGQQILRGSLFRPHPVSGNPTPLRRGG